MHGLSAPSPHSATRQQCHIIRYVGLMWPSLLIINWTPIFESYMARFVLKNGHQKRQRVTMTLDYGFRIQTPFWVRKWTQLRGLCDHLKNKRIFIVLKTFSSLLWLWNLKHDSQLLINWIRQSIAELIQWREKSGVGSAYNSATYLNPLVQRHK